MTCHVQLWVRGRFKGFREISESMYNAIIDLRSKPKAKYDIEVVLMERVEEVMTVK